MMSKKTSWVVVLYNKSIKNKIALVITFIGLLVLISGTSYAILKGNVYSDDEQVIKAGSVVLKLTENFENIDKKIMIMEDSEGLLQETTYDFNIKNIGDSTARYDVKLVNEVPTNYTGEVLPIEYIKVGLEINEEEYGPMSLEELNGLIDSGIIYKKEVINYKLRIWLDSDKQNEIEELSDYKAFLKLKVEVEQRPDSLDEKNAIVFNYTGEEQKYKVTRDGWYYVELGGAEGGSAKYNIEYSGGLGAITSGYVELKAGEELYFNVGGMGGSHSGSTTDTYSENGKGYNGGSTGNFYASNSNAGGGGGATDVRIFDDEVPTKYRYVRDYLNGSNENGASHWVEIKVYDELGNLISQGKNVTYNGDGVHYGGGASSISLITDGDTDTAKYFGLDHEAYVEIDLGKECFISKVEVWHYYGDGRTYYDTKTELLNNDKTEKYVLFDSKKSGTYAETSSGKTSEYVNLNEDINKGLIARIMVAGGGGGADSHVYAPSWSGNGGNAEGLYGHDADYIDSISSNCYNYGAGGTQISGGNAVACSSSQVTASSGTFGFGGRDRHSGGGGGYYGGGSGTHTSAGGGSSYISGFAGVNSVANNTTITHTNQTLHYSGKYFVGGNIVGGSNKGNGYAKIVYVDEKPKRKNTKLNNVRYLKNCVSYNSANNDNHWVELQAIKDGVNIAKGKNATGVSEDSKSWLTDGDITYEHWVKTTSSSSPACTVVDLENVYDLDEVAVWNYFGDDRSYYDNTTYVSSDNSNWVKVINDASVETSNGNRVNAYTDTYSGYIQDNLVLWFDGYANTGSSRSYSAATWKDLSGTGNDATVREGTWNYDNLYFDGVNDYAYRGAASYDITNDQYTLEVVLKPKKDKGFQLIFDTVDTGDGLQQYMTFWIHSTQGFMTDAGNGTNAFSTYYSNDIIVDKKYSLSTTLNSNILKIYEQAKLDKTNNLSIIPKITKSGLYIGGSSYPFNGSIYSVRVYNRTLTDDEILHNYLVDKQRFNIE